jgi:hypothetical protein
MRASVENGVVDAGYDDNPARRVIRPHLSHQRLGVREPLQNLCFVTHVVSPLCPPNLWTHHTDVNPKSVQCRKYEFVIFRDEDVAERKGFFTTSTQARRAGLKAAQALIAAEEERCPSLPL